MNQGRIWTVVPPAVGLPLIIGGAAVTSLLVHAEILNHTTWFSAYWNGKAAKTADLGSTSATALNAGAFSVSVTPTQAASGATSFVVTVTPAAAPAAVGSTDPHAVALATEPAK